MPSKEDYLQSILVQHQNNIVDPNAILKNLLLEYNAEYFGYNNPVSERKLYQKNVFLFEINSAVHNMFLSGKLIKLLDHPKDGDHIFSVIERLNQNQDAANGRLVDENLINLLSAFFSVYERYNSYLSDELSSSLNIESFYTCHYNNFLKEIFAQLENKDNSLSSRVISSSILGDTHGFDFGSTQDKIIDEIIGVLNDYQHYYNWEDACNILSNLNPYIAHKHELQIEYLIKILLNVSFDIEMYRVFPRISKALAKLIQFVSPQKQESLFNQLFFYLEQPCLNDNDFIKQKNATAALTYLKDFIPTPKKKLVIDTIIERLQNYAANPFSFHNTYSDVALEVLWNLKADITSKEQRADIVDILINRLNQIDVVNIKQTTCKALIHFKSFIPNDKYDSIINALIENVDAIKPFESANCKIEACEALLEFHEQIPTSMQSLLIKKLLNILRCEYTFGLKVTASELLLKLEPTMEPNERTTLTNTINTFITQIQDNKLNTENLKSYLKLQPLVPEHIRLNTFNTLMVHIIDHASGKYSNMISATVCKISAELNLSAEEKFILSKYFIDAIVNCNDLFIRRHYIDVLKNWIQDLTCDEQVFLLSKLINKKYSFEGMHCFVSLYKNYHDRIAESMLANKLPIEIVNMIYNRQI